MVEISLAPMMKYTTPLFIMLLRKTSKNAILFTEMIVSSTVIHVTHEELKFMLGDPEDSTVVQLGGSNAEELSQAVKILKSIRWTHFNLNFGCPSERVQNGRFGAILMLEKENVADIINRIYEDNRIVTSLKIRIGVDEHDSFEFFIDFVHYISTTTPCLKFYIHARKCWLCRLNPKQNRNVPALNYQFFYDLKTLYPHLFISLNGGLKDNFIEHIKNLDGAMLGRHAVEDIFVFAKHEQVDVYIKIAIKKYIEEASQLTPPMTKLMMTLINLRKGKTNATVLKQTFNKIIREKVPYDQVYQMIEPYLSD